MNTIFNLKTNSININSKQILLDSVTKSCFDCKKYLEVLKEKLNYSLIYTEEEKRGQFVNNSWDGLIGRLVRNESDFGISIYSADYDRYQVSQFSPAFDTVYLVSTRAEKLPIFQSQSQPIPPNLNPNPMALKFLFEYVNKM